MNKPTKTESLRNKPKNRVGISSRTSKKSFKSSYQQSKAEIKIPNNSDSIKLNTFVGSCGSKESIKLSHPTFGYQVIKRLVSDEAEKIMLLQNQAKPRIDNRPLRYNTESNCNIHKGYKKKKVTKSRNHTFWDSNLTGARRVSKRLTKLRFKNKKLINPETASEKYKLNNISHKDSTKEKLSVVQRSLAMNIPQNKLKLNRKTTVKKPLSTRNLTKKPTQYGRLESHKRPLHPKMESTEQVQTRPHLFFMNKRLKQFNKTEIILKSNNHTNFCGSEGQKPFITSISADSESGTEDEVSCSLIEEKINDLVNLDLKIEEAADPCQNIEENCLENESDSVVKKTIQDDIQETVTEEIQEECEGSTEIMIVEIETENGVPSFTPVTEKCSSIGKNPKEKYQEEEDTNELTNIPKPSNLIISDEILSTTLEFKGASLSENAVGDDKTKNDSKEEMDLTLFDNICKTRKE